MELTLNQTFTIEKLNRDIDSCNDIDQVKRIAKQLLHLSEIQKAQSRWLIQNSIPTLTDYSAAVAELAA